MTQLDVLVDTLFRCVKRLLQLNSPDGQILFMNQQANNLTGPLAGLRVLEIEAIGPVTWAGMVLSDLGAQVIRIDRPAETEISQGFSPQFQFTQRGRDSIILDLKSEQGVDSALGLVSHADVLIEGMRPGVMERLGLGPEICMARNQRLVYGRMTGWGQDGPWSQMAGHDINYIGLTGALHAIGPRHGRPSVPLNLVGDFGGGAMLLLVGVLSAIWEARNSGHGQVVDAAMVDGSMALLAPIFGRLQSGQWIDERESNLLDGGAPFYGTYETSDGRYMAVGAIEATFYKNLLDGLGLNAKALPAQMDRSAWPVLRELFAQVFRQRTRDEWCDVFTNKQACVTPVLSLMEVPNHSHHLERQAFVEVDGVPQPAPAPRFSRTLGRAGPISKRGGGAKAALLRWGLKADDPMFKKLSSDL